MRHLPALVRWPNLLMLAGTFVLLRHGLMEGMHATTLLRPCLGPLHWWLMGAATVLIAASGNVVNDIFDQDIDRANRPSTRIVGVELTEDTAWNIYYALAGTGLALGLLLAWMLGNVADGMVFLLSLGGLWFYSYSYKRQFLIGNLVVALLAGVAVYLPLLFEMICDPQGWRLLPYAPFIAAYAAFAALSTLIREMVKDMEDADGDSAAGCRTLPIVLGKRAAAAIVSALTALMMLAVGRYQLAQWEANGMLAVLWLTAGVQLPSALMLRAVWQGRYARGSLLAKATMAGGILSMLLFRWA